MARPRALKPGMEPVPGYRLEQFLGRGGWGEVWKAQRPSGEPAALKFLHCHCPTSAAQEIRALQAIRQLKHPNIIRTEQIWSIPGAIVVAMELADGNLLEMLNRYADEGQPFPPENVCFFLSQAASALDFLNTRQHQLNGQRVAVRHCDVKPTNLLIKGDTIKLADFSLAVQTTNTLWYHRRAGTHNYAAPEVFQGQLSDRTDQYALAVTYCQLRGGLPFPEPPQPTPKSYRRPAPDLSFCTQSERPILARALAPVPQDRWRSCREMVERLSECFAERGAVLSQR